MGQLTEYFVRHYTLVLDNDQVPYERCRDIASDVVREGGLTFEEYQVMSEGERADEFASDIGDRILEMIHEEIDEALHGESGGSMGELAGSLIREIMIVSDSEIGYELGKHYMPEDSDMEGVLESDEDDEDDEDES
jgi:hypothetical protein